MSFYLYTSDDKALRHHKQVKNGEFWTKHGAVATCGKSKVLPNCGGPWCVTETELLRHMKDRHENMPDFGNDEPENRNLVQYAIIDDLLPNGPDVIMARIIRIRGFLDAPYPNTSDPNNTDDRYNPFIIEMQEVLSIPSSDERSQPAGRYETKRTIPVRPGDVIRSIGYFRKGWSHVRGPFSAALLWPKHWNWLRDGD